MPRKIDPRFGADQPVELGSDETPSAEGLARVIDLLVGQVDQQTSLKALTEIAEDYLRWCKQDEQGVTNRQRNEQLRLLAGYSQTFTDDPARAETELKPMIAGLSNQAFFALSRTPTFARLQGDQPWTIQRMMDDVPAVLPAASEASEQGRPGPTHDMTLAITVDRLVQLYEGITGKLATHTPRSKTHYDGAPRSAAGQFIVAFFAALPGEMKPTYLSTPLALAIKARRARWVKTQGSN